MCAAQEGNIVWIVNRLDRVEYLVRCRTAGRPLLQLVGKYVEQDFRVRSGIQVATIFARQDIGQLLSTERRSYLQHQAEKMITPKS